MQKLISLNKGLDPMGHFNENVVMFSFDNDFKFISGNLLFDEITLFKQKEIKGKDVFIDLFHKLPLHTIDDVKYTIKQGKIWQGNLKLPHGINQKKWYHIQILPIINETGEKIGYTTICSLGKSQNDLISADESSQTWMKAIFNDPEEANILINREGQIIDFNKAAYSFAEWCVQKPLGIDSLIFEYFHPRFEKTLKAFMDKSFKGKKQKFCRNFKNIAGFSKIFDVELRPVFSNDKTVMGIVMVIIDITAQVELTKRIKLSEKRLSDIAFINAHEVRAPLASILGLIQLLDYEGLNESSIQILNRLKKSANELDNIIHKVSKTSYLEDMAQANKSA